MTFHVRVCRECGEEYRPEIVRCADCGGELEDVYEDGRRRAPAPAPSSPPTPKEDLSDHRTVFETARASDLVPLADCLREARIPFRLGEKAPAGDGAPVLFALLVAQDRSREALVAIAPLLAAEHGDEAGFDAVETGYEEGRGYVRCPACGTAPPPGASECPECGLTLAADVPTCARCGSTLPSHDAECPTCGGEPPAG